MDFERFDRASALYDLGRAQDALREFEALAEQASSEDDRCLALLYKANCLEDLGRVSEARQFWLQATAIRTSPYSEVLDASLCIAEGKPEEALKKLKNFLIDHVDLQSASEWNAYSGAQNELGRLLFNMERYREAVGPLEGALASTRAGQRWQICFYLGVCHLFNGKLEEAEAKLIESLPANRSDPWWVQAQYYLGCVYFKQGSYLKARWSFEASLSFIDDSDTDFKEKVLSWLGKIPL